jgi:hypothetical protein
VTAHREALPSPAPITVPGERLRTVLARVRDYVASERRRAYQTALALLWLLDGALQYQPFMYSDGFIEQLKANASRQPHWVSDGINGGANVAHSRRNGGAPRAPGRSARSPRARKRARPARQGAPGPARGAS